MKAKDIMTREIISKSIDDSIFEIAKTMKNRNIGFIPIHKNNKIIGVLTDRDIVTEMITNRDINHTKNYLYKNIVTANMEDSINFILRKMKENKVKRILIVEKNRLVGIISLSDIFRIQKEQSAILETLQSIFEIESIQEERLTEIDEFYL